MDAIGGPVLIEHSEDAHTGFELTAHGWRVSYVPIILAIGLCPDDAHAYFHQQHRWGMGSLSLLLDKKFWKSKLSWKTKLCYIAGFLFYLSQPIAILFSFQLFYVLFMYGRYMSLANAVLFVPAMLWGYWVLLFFAIARFRWGVFLTLFMQTYAYSHAVFASVLKSTVAWLPTNTKMVSTSLAFKQTTLAIGIYVTVYLALAAFALRDGLLQLFNYNYFPLEFWIFYNLIITGILLWTMYRTMEGRQVQQLETKRWLVLLY